MTYPGMTVCPTCGRENEVHSGANVMEPPDEGSVSLCWNCRGIALFQANGMLRLPTEEERVNLMADPDVKAALHAMVESYTPTQAVGMTRPMPLELNE